MRVYEIFRARAHSVRHLAAKWESTYVQTHSKRRLLGDIANELSGIEHFILLDLLGAPQPSIRSFFLDTAWLYDALVDAERRLGDSGAFAYGEQKSMAPGNWRSYFRPRTSNLFNAGYIGDDHAPFLHRGVPILHLIAEPFPRVWHTLKVSSRNYKLGNLLKRELGRCQCTGCANHAAMEFSSPSVHVRVSAFAAKGSQESFR